MNTQLHKTRVLRDILPRVGALAAASPQQLQAMACHLAVDAGQRVRNTAHLAPRARRCSQRARSNKKIVTAVITHLYRFAEGVANLNAEDGAVADVGSLEAIAHSVAVCSRNDTQ